MKKKIVTLFLGTGAGQVIQFLCLPLISRLYSPEMVGAYGALLAFSALAATLVGMRLEVDYVRVSPENRDSLTKTFLCVCLISSLVLFGVLNAGWLDAFLPDSLSIGKATYFYLTLLTFSLAIFEYNVVMLSVESKIKKLAVIKGIRGGGTSIIQVLLPLMGFVGVVSLIISDLMIRTFSSLNNGFRFILSPLNFKHIFTSDRVKLVLSSFLSKAVQNSPYIIIGYTWGAEHVGFYFLTQRSLGAVMALLGKSISAAYVSELASDIRTKKDSMIWRRVRNITLKSSMISLPFFVTAGLVGFIFMAEIFGNQWDGFFMAWVLITPLYFVRFCFSPMSQTLSYLGRSGLQLLWEFGRLIFVTVVLFLPNITDISFEISMLYYSSAAALSYLLLYFLVYKNTANVSTR